MKRFKKWIMKLILISLHKADVNEDGFVELSVKLDIKTKEVLWEIK